MPYTNSKQKNKDLKFYEDLLLHPLNTKSSRKQLNKQLVLSVASYKLYLKKSKKRLTFPYFGISYVYTKEANMKHTKLVKWGNSLGLRIPKAFAEEINLKENSSVSLSLLDGALIIKPVPKNRYSLQELLDGITDKNLQSEEYFQDTLGEELL